MFARSTPGNPDCAPQKQTTKNKSGLKGLRPAGWWEHGHVRATDQPRAMNTRIAPSCGRCSHTVSQEGRRPAAHVHTLENCALLQGLKPQPPCHSGCHQRMGMHALVPAQRNGLLHNTSTSWSLPQTSALISVQLWIVPESVCWGNLDTKHARPKLEQTASSTAYINEGRLLASGSVSHKPDQLNMKLMQPAR